MIKCAILSDQTGLPCLYMGSSSVPVPSSVNDFNPTQLVIVNPTGRYIDSRCGYLFSPSRITNIDLVIDDFAKLARPDSKYMNSGNFPRIGNKKVKPNAFDFWRSEEDMATCLTAWFGGSAIFSENLRAAFLAQFDIMQLIADALEEAEIDEDTERVNDFITAIIEERARLQGLKGESMTQENANEED